MRNKLTGILLALLIILTSFPVYAGEAPAWQDYEAGLLGSLGITVEGEASDEISRSEFAGVISRFACLSGVSSPNEYYYDVTEAQWNSGVGAVTLAGYMNGYENNFSPDRAVTVNEAATVFMRVAGFGVIAEQNSGYLRYASTYDLLDGIDASESSVMTRAMLCKMMYNALFVPYVETVTMGDKTEYAISRSENILSEIYDIYEGSGIVTANSTTGLSSADSAADEGRIKIDNIAFRDSGSFGDRYIGNMVTYYYRDTENTAVDEIVFVREYDTQDTLTVNFADLDAAGGNIRRVENNKYRDVKISSYCAVLLNGVCSQLDIVKDKINTAEGEITFIDHNGDKTYDALICRVTEFFFVRQKVNDSMLVYDEITGEILDLSEEDDVIKVIYKDGELSDFSKLAQHDVLEVERSSNGKYICVNASQYRVLGLVEEIDEDNFKIKIDGEYFDIPKSGLHKDVKAGKKGIYYISTSGYLVWADVFESEYGCVIGIAESSGLSDEVSIKVLNSLGEIDILKLAEKCVYKNTGALLTAGDIPKNDIIKFSCNSDGEIKELWTAEVNYNEEGYNEDVFTLDASTDFYVRSVSPMCIGTNDTSKQYILNEATVIFKIPENGGSEEDYSVASTAWLVGDQSYSMKVYDSDRYKIPAVIAVKSKSVELPINTTALFITDKFSRVLDDNGIECVRVSGYINNKAVAYTFSDSVEELLYDESGKLKYSFGDIFQLNVTPEDEIIGLIPILTGDTQRSADNVWITGSGETPAEYTGSSTIKLYDDRFIMYGLSKNVNSAEMSMTVTSPSKNVTRLFPIGGAVVAIIDFEEKTIKAGSANDIPDDAYVLARSRRQDVEDVIVFKNLP